MARRLPLMRALRRGGAPALLALAVGLAPAAGQDVRLGRVTGLVFDSLTGRPLPGAVVSAQGSAATDTTDADGGFELRLPAGASRITFEHARVSDWSLLWHETVVDVEPDRVTSVTLATASPRTVVERACGGVGNVIGGVVRDLLTLVPIPGAQVTVQRDSGAPSTVVSRQDGQYHVCLGGADRVSVDARLGTDRSRRLSLGVPAGGVTTRDLFVPASEPATLSGRVLDGDSGEPLEDVTIAVVGSRLRAGTRADGSFLLRGLAPGSVGLRVERIGYAAGEARVEAAGGDSLDVTLELFEDAVDLAPMVVTVSGRAQERLRAGTRFDGLDRPQIEALLPRSIGFDDLLRNANVPGLKIRAERFVGNTGMLRDGICVETSRRSTSSSQMCEMVEVYVNDVRIPEAEFFLESLSPESIERFELLSRSEATIRYGGTLRARNGVLLIYTRGR